MSDLFIEWGFEASSFSSRSTCPQKNDDNFIGGANALKIRSMLLAAAACLRVRNPTLALFANMAE